MDDPPRRMRRITLRKGDRWRIGGVIVTASRTVEVEVDADAAVERVKQTCPELPTVA